MTTALQLALPGANVDNATMVAKLAEQAIIVVDDLDAVVSEDFSVQPWAGICSLGDGSLFMYDAADTTSAHDGMTVIVVSGRRYILRTTQIFDGFVASAGDTAPPGSPSLGDTYIIGAAPSGDWAAKAKNIAKWTARGWVYRAPAQGMVFWVADEQTYYHYSASDDWTQGLPIGAIADGSISPLKLANPLAVLAVEDERDAPPGSVPAAGTAYIVGTSPIGGFAGHAGDVAWSNGTDYDFIAGSEGAVVYNRDVGELYAYRSGLWGSLLTTASAVNFYLSESGAVSNGTVGASEELIDTLAVQGTPGNKWVIDCHYLHVDMAADYSEVAIEVYLDTETEPQATLFQSETGVSALDYSSWGGHRAIVDVPDGAAHNLHIKVREYVGVANATSVDTEVNWTVTEMKPSA